MSDIDKLLEKLSKKNSDFKPSSDLKPWDKGFEAVEQDQKEEFRGHLHDKKSKSKRD